MRIVLRSLLAGAAVFLAEPASARLELAQLDLSPPRPGAAARPAPQQARRPAVRAPRRAPVPEPRPAEAGAGEPELSSLPSEAAPAPEAAPQPPVVTAPAPPVPAPPPPAAAESAPPAPPPVQAVPEAPRPEPARPETPLNPIDEAFRDTARSSSRAAPIPPNHPAVLSAPARNGLTPPPAPLPPPGGAPLTPPRAQAAPGTTEASAGEHGSHFNWGDHENRIRQIEQRFGGQNYGIIAR